jgi:hypothetical protein
MVMPLAAGVMFDPSCLRSRGTGAEPQRTVFYAAGGRFYKTNRLLRRGELVCVKRETFAGKVCYGIHTEDGQRIGYVPREMLQILDSRRIIRAEVVSTRDFGVPWNRYKICLTTTTTY